MRVIRLALAALLASSGAALANELEKCETHERGEPQLCGYELTSVGYTKDSDDVGFLDLRLSLRFQVMPELMTRALNQLSGGMGDNSALYFAFSGRFGQYIGTRDSSPVVEKRFEPKLFIRHWLGPPDQHRDYWDFAYGHESNGQSVHTAAQLASARASAERPEFANDQISRGWDFVEVTRKVVFRDDDNAVAAYLRARYFLSKGILQGEAEQYQTFESDTEGKPRNRVNGLSAMLRYRHGWEPDAVRGEGWRDVVFSGTQVTLGYETGYRDPFHYNTFRFELGRKVYQVPVNLWFQTGYGSDLALYYKRVNSRGIEVQFSSF